MEKNERFKINKLSMFQKPNPKKGEYRLYQTQENRKKTCNNKFNKTKRWSLKINEIDKPPAMLIEVKKKV